MEVRPGAQSYSIHVGVHDWLIKGVDSTLEEQQQRYSIAFDCTASSISSDDSVVFPSLEYIKIAAHVLRLGNIRFLSPLFNDDFTVSRAAHINNIGELLRQQGHLDIAEKMLKRALAGKEKALGAEHILTLLTFQNLSGLYCDQGKLEVAEKMYNRALIGYEKALGAEHISTLYKVSNLGLLCFNQGKLDTAEKIYNRVLAAREQSLGAGHTSTLDTVNNIGRLYFDQDKLDAAEQMYNRALLQPLAQSTISAVYIVFKAS